MKLGISKGELLATLKSSSRYFGGMITGMGLGMFLAIAFIPKDGRKIFDFDYITTALILTCIGNIFGSAFQNKPKENSVNKTPTD
ncbi:MAG TPA: hypothetical protein VHG71_02040 [Verrucomicrobiae bacterium]|nr:hypothetical protein [Verrucomicrobiae bacterium]